MNVTNHQVSYDHRAITVDGQRRLLLSGAIHYPRSTPEQWPELIARSREAGLNTIETYVFWNLHEARQGIFDFSGRLDLPRFCAVVQEAGMHLILRIGPYICAEINYGGLPFWLRDVPGMQIRTQNEPWQREMGRWTRQVTDLLRPYFAPNGGPIILAQIENEYNNIRANYGAAGETYLEWAANFAEDLHLDIPWIMCVGGGTAGTIETLNGFFVHDAIPAHRQKHPTKPLLWTEHWPGWYDTWGHPHHLRDAREVAYAALRFFAAGGTGMNYYMWHGGTNFGRESMYLQTTSYDFDAPLDEYGRSTTKSHHLARLHHTLLDHAATLLATEDPQHEALGPDAGRWSYGDLAFLYNDQSEAEVTVEHAGQAVQLAPRSVQIFADGALLFVSDIIAPEDVVSRTITPTSATLTPAGQWHEPTGGWYNRGRHQSALLAEHPREQLALTQDATDYCWYVTTYTAVHNLVQPTLTLRGMADIAHVFVGDQFLGTTAATRLREDRGPFDGTDFLHTLTLPDLPAGSGELAILCVATGLIKGDWMIAQRNMVEERKGIWGDVTLEGATLGTWHIQPGLVGEALNLAGDGALAVAWDAPSAESRLTWHRFTFPHPSAGEALAVDLMGLTRGMLWLNGRHAGRYWLITSMDPDGKNPYGASAGQIPTQRYYHLPLSWLRATNTLLVFDELGGTPKHIQLVQP